jgi:hypothetical protein
VTVVPDASVTPPATGPGACAGGGSTLVLGCTPLTGRCGDVYAVTVALERVGSSSPLQRFTTFLTYQEPTAISPTGGRLNVGVVVPVGPSSTATLASALSDHRDVPTTLEVSPAAVQRVTATPSRDGGRALQEIATLDAQEVLGTPFVPINVAALSQAGLPGEVGAQMTRGDELLRTVGLRPSGGTWVDTTSSFSQGDAGGLANGLQEAGASQLVLNDGDLASGGETNYTFAQPFTLELGHGTTVTAAVSDSTLSARFTADPSNPVLDAEQLLAGLSFVHFENAFLSEPRGVVITPGPGWQPSGPFMETLLSGLSGNPALKAVTLGQLFATVPIGGNHEPETRQLQSGPAGHSISRSAADHIALARQQLSSYAKAITVEPPPELTAVSDLLLATETKGLSTAGRTAALDVYQRAFAAVTGKISLATEQTVTFTAQQASIPITVLSAASYPLRVVVTLASDKFTFPDGNTRPLLLDRPTTSVRVTAHARTSGDHLPIEVTLHTPNGQLLLAHTVLTVHSTAISFVGVALSILAGAVLLVWWARTWWRSRRQRLRAH